jgi:hypothetical protein
MSFLRKAARYCLLEWTKIIKRNERILEQLKWYSIYIYVGEGMGKSLKNKRKYKNACYLIHACFLIGLLLNPEDGGDIFL